MKEEVSRQRISQLRCRILQALVVWTIQAPYRLVWFKGWWGTFHWLVYKQAQKYQEGMKLCARCQKLGREYWHPVENFGKNRWRSDGLSGECKQCDRERKMIIQERDPEAAREKRRKWEKMHPEKVREYRERTYKKHKEKNMQRAIEWRKNNKARWNAYIRTRYAQNKAKEKER